MIHDSLKYPFHFVEIQRICKAEDRGGLNYWYFKGRLVSSFQIWEGEPQNTQMINFLGLWINFQFQVITYTSLYCLNNVFEAGILCLIDLKNNNNNKQIKIDSLSNWKSTNLDENLESGKHHFFSFFSRKQLLILFSSFLNKSTYIGSQALSITRLRGVLSPCKTRTCGSSYYKFTLEMYILELGPPHSLWIHKLVKRMKLPLKCYQYLKISW